MADSARERQPRRQSRASIHLATARESLARILQSPSTALMTLAVIGIALLLPATLSVALDNVRTLAGDLDRASRINVYLEPVPARERLSALTESLSSRHDVAAVDYISPEQAAQSLAAESGLGDVLDSLPDNPLPATLVVQPATTDYASIRALGEHLQTLDGVASVQLDLQWLRRLDSFLQLIERAALALAVIVAVAVLFIVGNTIRLAVANRRAEIRVAKLVGATDAFVARPFLYTGLWYGLGGGVLAWLLLNAIMAVLQGPVQRLLTLYDSQQTLAWPGGGMLLMLAGGGAALGWLGALISLRQHLREIEPDQ